MILDITPSPERPVIGWWSGGVTSAVACKIAANLWGVERVRFVMIDTMNEHDDTYRFKKDCEKWYGRGIETIKNKRYDSIEEVWYRFNSLNVANGAVCSSQLKREVREKFETRTDYSYQVFGFTADKQEANRARSMKLNYPNSNPIFPLIMYGLEKPECIEYLEARGLDVPATYYLGLQNNNCWKTGCVQGGIGYWQWMRQNAPEKFEKMAKVEHELTDRRGKPVTMLKDRAAGGGYNLFLKPHPDYPGIRDISMKKGRKPTPLVECNGFCGLDDLNHNQGDGEASGQASLFGDDG